MSSVYGDAENCVQGAVELARLIAAQSPVAVQGTKKALNYSRGHTEQEGLEFMQIWNMCMLQSEDFIIASSAIASKQGKPEFGDL